MQCLAEIAAKLLVVGHAAGGVCVGRSRACWRQVFCHFKDCPCRCLREWQLTTVLGQKGRVLKDGDSVVYVFGGGCCAGWVAKPSEGVSPTTFTTLEKFTLAQHKQLFRFHSFAVARHGSSQKHGSRRNGHALGRANV